jgi:hypothetical protein
MLGLICLVRSYHVRRSINHQIIVETHITLAAVQAECRKDGGGQVNIRLFDVSQKAKRAQTGRYCQQGNSLMSFQGAATGQIDISHRSIDSASGFDLARIEA